MFTIVFTIESQKLVKAVVVITITNEKFCIFSLVLTITFTIIYKRG